jgi:DNA-binding LacI/PurR family transcriptional regulator
MSDIAQLAGVSESTVSRALGGSPLISAPTRARIRQIAAEQGYTIDQTARNLRMQRTGTIGVVFPLLHEAGGGISDPFFLEMLGHLADEFHDRQHDLLLQKIGPQAPRGLAALIAERRTDGLVIIGQSTQHETLNELAASYKPLVVWGAPVPGAAYVTVGSDNAGGARAAAAHLLGLGHRRIAFFGDRSLPEVAARHAGYAAALHAAGLTLDPALECRAPFDQAGAQRAMSRFFDDADPGFDAIFAASDLLAMAAIRALDQRGRRVPRDVAVVGFDDIMLAGAYTPALTTVRQDLRAGAAALVDALFARMAGGSADATTLPARLVVRTSCGASAVPPVALAGD